MRQVLEKEKANSSREWTEGGAILDSEVRGGFSLEVEHFEQTPEWKEVTRSSGSNVQPSYRGRLDLDLLTVGGKPLFEPKF